MNTTSSITEINQRFYDINGNFNPISMIKNNEFLACMPKMGISRPQTNNDVLCGKDGRFLVVYENMGNGKAYKQIPENWDDESSKRFLEIYGPIGLTSFRFDRWMDEKINSKIVKEN